MWRKLAAFQVQNFNRRKSKLATIFVNCSSNGMEPFKTELCLFRATLMISQETKCPVSIIYFFNSKTNKLSTENIIYSLLQIMIKRGCRIYIQRVKPQTLWIISEYFFLVRLRVLLCHFACVFTGSVYKVPNSSTLCDS